MNTATPAAWTVGTVVAYLGLYTAYSKQTKTLVPGDLLDVLLVRKSVDHTLVQMNKVISLAGITTLAVSLAPGAEQVVTDTHELLQVSMGMLTVHSCYSTFKYYGSPNIPVLSSFPSMIGDFLSDDAKVVLSGKKKASILFGLAATAALDSTLLGYLDASQWVSVGALSASFLHFYLMEQDFKGKLQVRPFGYLGFIAPIAALGLLLPALAK